jgi:integrase
MVDLGAGCGLRQGEIFAVDVDELDFESETLHVVQQIKYSEYKLVFASPKGGKLRDVPLSGPVADAIQAHMKRFPPVEITLPWGGIRRAAWLRGEPHAAAREHGMHALRHFYASVLLDARENIKALSEYLGHHDPGFTLRTYTHLMPSSRERTRNAVAAVFAPDPKP